jgi:hypothetical protein
MWLQSYTAFEEVVGAPQTEAQLHTIATSQQ